MKTIFRRRHVVLQRTLAECAALLQQDESLQGCVRRFPAFAREIEAHFAFTERLRAGAIEEPSRHAQAAGRRALLLALARQPQAPRRRALEAGRGAGTAIAALVLAGALGLGVATANRGLDLAAPLGDLLQGIGVGVTAEEEPLDGSTRPAGNPGPAALPPAAIGNIDQAASADWGQVQAAHEERAAPASPLMTSAVTQGLGPVVAAPPVETPPLQPPGPPAERPPVAAPPLETPPVAAPPANLPPLTIPPLETPPLVTPPLQPPGPPAEHPPVAAPPLETPPVAAPPVGAPPDHPLGGPPSRVEPAGGNPLGGPPSGVEPTTPPLPAAPPPGVEPGAGNAGGGRPETPGSAGGGNGR